MSDPGKFPPEVRGELGGWSLVWFRLKPTGAGDQALVDLREKTARRIQEQYQGVTISERTGVAALRKLFRAAGCDPTRYRPSSEALLRRVLKGGSLPAINPLVDLNNLVSISLPAPCCVIDARSVAPPFTFRAGRPGESMESMRGPFNLEGKPLLEDDQGPFGTPITDSERVKVLASTEEAWLVVYLPEGTAVCEPEEVLRELLAAAPVAELLP